MLKLGTFSGRSGVLESGRAFLLLAFASTDNVQKGLFTLPAIVLFEVVVSIAVSLDSGVII